MTTTATTADTLTAATAKDPRFPTLWTLVTLKHTKTRGTWASVHITCDTKDETLRHRREFIEAFKAAGALTRKSTYDGKVYARWVGDSSYATSQTKVWSYELYFPMDQDKAAEIHKLNLWGGYTDRNRNMDADIIAATI